MDCNVNPINGNQSVLLSKLKEVLGNEELAQKEFDRVKSPNFLKVFGNWIEAGKEGYPVEGGPDIKGTKFGKRVYPTGEPKIFERNGQFFYKTPNGNPPIWLHAKRYPKMTVTQVRDTRNQFVFDVIRKLRNFDFNDSELLDKQKKKITFNVNDIITESLDEYLNSVTEGKAEEEKKVALIKEYQSKFAEDVAKELKHAGFNIELDIADVTHEDGTPISEMQEEEKVTTINFKDNFESNPKDKARANTKLFLSTVKKLKREKVKETGKFRYMPVRGSFLKRFEFVKFEEVYQTLSPILADIVAVGDSNDTMINSWDQMIKRMESLAISKPWIVGLIKDLNSDKLPTYKKLEFMQAFSMVRLNFNVTEYDKENQNFTVINATSTNSKASKIKDTWTTNFLEEFTDYSTNIGVGLAFNQNSVKEIKDLSKKFTQLSRVVLKEKQISNVEAIQQSMDLLRKVGIEVSGKDMQVWSIQNGGMSEIRPNLNRLLKRVSSMLDTSVNSPLRDKYGTFKNPLETEKEITKLAEAAGLNNIDISENTVVMNQGKMAWTYSTPSYLHNTLNRMKTSYEEVKKKNAEHNRGSRWAKWFAASEQDESGPVFSDQVKEGEELSEREKVSQERLAKTRIDVDGSFTSKGKNDGVAPKNIEKTDAIKDSVNKVLGEKTSAKKSVYQTIIAADKSKKFEIEGPPMLEAKVTRNDDGTYEFSEETIDQFIAYFEDEYERMKKVQKELDDPNFTDYIAYYHTNENGLESQLFPSLSRGVAPEDLANVLYDGNKIFDNGTVGFTQTQRTIVSKHIKSILSDRMQETMDSLVERGLIIENIMEGQPNDASLLVSKQILDAYDVEDKATAIVGDYFINSTVAAVEYTKIFSGDPAYYKNMTDMFKRIPGTYTDGSYLAIDNMNEARLNVAVVENVEIASKYLEDIKKSFSKKELESKEVQDLIDLYGKVDTTDAQAWITPDRWRFILTKLGKWSPRHEKVYEGMLSGKALKPEDLKLAMQPLKGVYFGMDDNGKPTYLKYSQAVIIPSMVKGTPMDKLYQKMITNPETGKPYSRLEKHLEVHEVVTFSGIKVGAVKPTVIHDSKGDMLDNVELNPMRLDNRNWKLQQDLPVKGDKQADVGSQIQKNILGGIAEFMGDPKVTFDVAGRKLTADELLQDLDNTVSSLSDLGVDAVKKKFDIRDDKINDMSSLYQYLIEEIEKRDGSENVLNALKKELKLDSIPQIGSTIQSVLLAKFNKEIIKIKTNGAAYIQVSPFGFQTMTEADKSSVMIVSKDYDGKGLKPPRLVNGEHQMGQCFAPASYIKKLLVKDGVDVNNLTDKQLANALTDGALEMITYRIPNQGMSSNDALKIVGILPDGMGDSIIAYDGVPKKTGSDFDIDKMFAMLPNLTVNKAGKIVAVSDKGTSKAAMQNKLLNIYKAVLTHPKNYFKLMNPIDSEMVKTDILGLTENPSSLDLQDLSPLRQIDIKFEYMAGKTGVAQTANHLVDHFLNQTLDIRFNGRIGLGNEKDGKTAFDMPRATDDTSIAQILSEFLNAYVDIAKDPFVTRGNHNQLTAGTTFMLIRAGVPIKWINRFIGQPIIRDWAINSQKQRSISGEGLMTEEGRLSAEDYTVQQYSTEEIFNLPTIDATDLGKFDEKYLENSYGKSVKDMSDKEKAEQLEILAQFMRIRDMARDFGDSVTASKAGENGAGGSAIDRLINENKVNHVIEKGNILGFEDKVRKTDDAPRETALSTYQENAVDWVGKVLDKSEIFVTAKRGVENLFNLVSTMAGKGVLRSKDFGRQLEKAYKAYMFSRIPAFQVEGAELKKIMEELPKRVLGAQKHPLTRDNFFIKEITVKPDRNRDAILLNSKNKPSSYENDIYSAWYDLLTFSESENDEHNQRVRDLAKDLAIYAYRQSGFSRNMQQFYSHLPHEFLIEQGVEDIVDAQFLESDAAMDDNSFIDQFFRHNYNDNSIVPFIPTKYVQGITVERDGKTFNNVANGGFTVTDKDFGLKDDEHGSPNGKFPAYVKMANKRGDILLYKLRGGLLDQTGEVDRLRAVYTPIPKLGTKTSRTSTVEYKYEAYGDNIIEDSAFDENNLGQFAKQNLATFTKAVNKWVSNGLFTPIALNDVLQTSTIKESDRETKLGNKLVDTIFGAQEERNTNLPKEDLSTFQKKAEYLAKSFGAEVIMDDSVSTSRLLPANHKLTKMYGKPVILINPNKIFKTTAIHEFGHIFIDIVPQGLNNPRVKKALKQLEGTQLWRDTKALYPDLNEEMFHKEVLAQAIGREGAIQWESKESATIFTNFINWLKDFVRRKLGIEGDAIASLSREVISGKIFDTSQFQASSLQEERNPSGATSERMSLLDKTYNDLIVRITTLHNINKPKTKKEKDYEYKKQSEGKETSRSRISELKDLVQELEDVDKVKGLLSYVEFTKKGLASLSSKIDKHGNEVDAETVSRWKNWLAAFNSIPDIAKLLDESAYNNKLAEEYSALLEEDLSKIIEDHRKLERRIKTIQKDVFAEIFAKHSNKVKTKWEKKFGDEYDSISPEGYASREEYVLAKMAENNELIIQEGMEIAKERAMITDQDLNKIAGLLQNHKNLNSEEIQIISKEIDRIKQRQDFFAQKKAVEFKDHFDDFMTRNSGMNNQARYGKFIEKSETGSYLINRYKPEFFEENEESKRISRDPDLYKEKYSGVTEYDSMGYVIDGEKKAWKFRMDNKDVDVILKGEYVHLVGKDRQMHVLEAIAISERNYWKKDNTMLKKTDKGTKTVPKDKWINPRFDALSEQDLKDLEQFKKWAKEADENYQNNIPLTRMAASEEHIRLPGVLASTLDRVASGKLKSAAADRFKDLYKVREDEAWEYQIDEDNIDRKRYKKVMANLDNHEAHGVPIVFRAKIEPKEQSLDLHSIFLMNLVHSQPYQELTEIDKTIDVFIDVMEERDVKQTSGIKKEENVHAFDTKKLRSVYTGDNKTDAKVLKEIREQRVYGIKAKGDPKAHKRVNTFLRWAGGASLLANWATEQVNILTGQVNNFIEAVGGQVYGVKDFHQGKLKYWKDLKDIIGDIGSNVQTSRTNVLLNTFNVMGDRNYLNNDFEENTRVKTLFKMNNIRAVASGGEHMLQAQVMYATMNSIKVLNAEGKYLDKNGNIVSSKDKAASIDEVIEIHKKDGELEIKLPDFVKKTTHTLSGGHSQILLETRNLIKKLIIDLHGAYDTDIQSIAQREWYWKLGFYLRKWMEPTLARRWRGITKAGVASEELREIDKFYSEDMKDYQEGYYATAFRFMKVVLPSAFKEAGIEGLKGSFGKLSKMEQANLRKVLTELSLVTVTTLAYAAMGGFDDENDDEDTLWARYILRREMAEIMFYWNPGEMYRIAATPSASMGFIEKNLRLIAQLTNPTEIYERGKFKGQLKVSKKAIDVVPVWAQLNRDIDASLKFLQW